jgi:hypothetical protein
MIMKMPANKVGGHFADRTGLEPATSAVTGQHSNQLNYRSFNPAYASEFNNQKQIIFRECEDRRFIFYTKIFIGKI